MKSLNIKLELDNQSDTEYSNANRSKKVIFEKILFANSLSIAPGAQIDKIITSSIKNPIAVVIVPFVAQNVAGCGVTAALPFGQYESPYWYKRIKSKFQVRSR